MSPIGRASPHSRQTGPVVEIEKMTVDREASWSSHFHAWQSHHEEIRGWVTLNRDDDDILPVSLLFFFSFPSSIQRTISYNCVDRYLLSNSSKRTRCFSCRQTTRRLEKSDFLFVRSVKSCCSACSRLKRICPKLRIIQRWLFSVPLVIVVRRWRRAKKNVKLLTTFDSSLVSSPELRRALDLTNCSKLFYNSQVKLMSFLPLPQWLLLASPKNGKKRNSGKLIREISRQLSRTFPHWLGGESSERRKLIKSIQSARLNSNLFFVTKESFIKVGLYCAEHGRSWRNFTIFLSFIRSVQKMRNVPWQCAALQANHKKNFNYVPRRTRTRAPTSSSPRWRCCDDGMCVWLKDSGEATGNCPPSAKPYCSLLCIKMWRVRPWFCSFPVLSLHFRPG